MRFILFILSTLISTCLFSQEIIDGSFEIQKTNKKYSLYIPSSYDEAAPQSLMVGFHPLNTSRWDGESWRDTLIQFAETNHLLLACPDGGPDGRIDDPIDTTFTTALIDSVQTWYNIDKSNQYAIGFSWGGRTAYSYSMNHPGVFKGVVPIGAAIEGTAQFNNVISNAADIAFYIVHGSNDSPGVRYTPVLNAFDEIDVCYDSRLLTGVGHTIDFPMRNEILSEAYEYVQNDDNCQTASSSTSVYKSAIEFYPNPIIDDVIRIKQNEEYKIASYEIFDLMGILHYRYHGASKELRTNRLGAGVFILKILHENGQHELRKLVFED